MDTKQRKSPGTEQRNPRTNAARKTEAVPNTNQNGKAAPQKRRTAASQPQGTKTASAARKTRKTAPQRKQAPATPTKKQTAQTRPPRRRPAPKIIYTPPKPFSRNRLLLRLVTVVAVVLAFTFGISIFFKVSTVTVSGNEKYTAWDVREASGIQEGDNLLTFGEAKASGRIIAALPYVESVRIGIKLPDTVNIEIKELDVVYAIRDQGGAWWLITAEGKIVEQVDSATAGQYTEILGVLLSLPRAGEQAVAMEPIAAASDAGETDEAGAAVPVTVLASQQLDTALNILQYLEANSIIGDVTSVDVTDLNRIELWYGQQYQVELGDTTQLNYKISLMNAAINGKDTTLNDYDTGVLDISFSIRADGVVYTPFS